MSQFDLPFWQYYPQILQFNINLIYHNAGLPTITDNISSLHNNFFWTSNLTNFVNFKEENNLVSRASSFAECNLMNNFKYLRKASFIEFFLNNMVDVPICLKKSKSLRTRNFELPVLKFSNFLMRQGKREKTIALLFNTARDLAQKLKNENLKKSSASFHWLKLFITTNNFFLNNDAKQIFFWNNVFDTQLENKIIKIFKEKNVNNFRNWDEWEVTSINKKYEIEILPEDSIIIRNNETTQNLEKKEKKEKKLSIDLTYDNHLIDSGKVINSDFFLKNFLLSKLSKISPIFSFFIYNVDKNIRKFSRGKSGKYTFVWKYIAPYKRLYLAMRWTAKDIKFYQNKSYYDRLMDVFLNLILDLEKSFAWKTKIFAYNFVFKNFRKSLMTSLKTTVKK